MRRQGICSIVSLINYNPHRSIHFCFSVVSSFSFSNKIHRFLVPLLTRGVALPLLLPGPVAQLFDRGRLCFKRRCHLSRTTDQTLKQDTMRGPTNRHIADFEKIGLCYLILEKCLHFALFKAFLRSFFSRPNTNIM